MSKGLHVGCLCVVVCGDMPENIGRIVEITKHDPSCPDGLFWETRPVNGMPLKGFDGDRGVEEKMFVWALSSELLPITPDESITQETDREVVV